MRSDTADLWLTQHRARFGVDLVPEGLDWLTVGLLAPHGLRKRRAKDFFWIETTAAPAPSRSAETPAPAAAMSAPAPDDAGPLPRRRRRRRSRRTRSRSS